MRIRRAIIIPTLIALAAAGSILAGSAAHVAAAKASTAHVLVKADGQPDVYYHA